MKRLEAKTAANASFEENHAWASYDLAFVYAKQEKWEEAFSVAENANPKVPHIIGFLAGVLKRMGHVNRAEEWLQQLSSDAYGTPLGLACFYITCGEIDKAAEWFAKAIELRHPLTAYLLSQIRYNRRWCALARLMNLPEADPEPENGNATGFYAERHK